MSYYFIVDTYIHGDKRGEYDKYIELVAPIVESYGGKYLARTENFHSLSSARMPQRIIIIEFETKEQIEKCFSSREYKEIMNMRISSVDSRGIIVPGIGSEEV